MEVGVDEAGRGCWAGPVFAAAVIWSDGVSPMGITDSKKLSEKQRDTLRRYIEENAIEWGVGMSTPQEIDDLNILNATYLAMHRALDKINNRISSILVDGNRFNGYNNIEYECIVKGDTKCINIAAASILAKTHKDEYTKKICEDIPELDIKYGWLNNKCYGTKVHRKGIEKYGITDYHRKSYKPCK